MLGKSSDLPSTGQLPKDSLLGACVFHRGLQGENMNSFVAERPQVEKKTGYEPYQSRATVLWFNSIKGYGYLQAHKTGDSAFVHHSNIVMKGYRFLEPGAQVDCEIIETPKGYSAIKVALLDK